jgi:plastocyanin
VHRWWVFVHLVGVFGFLMTHGVSVYVTFALRKERDPARVSQLLELSGSTIPFMWASIGVLLAGGIVGGFTGGFWGQAWIWAAIGVLIAVTAAMYAIATPWISRLRTISGAMAGGTQAVSQEQFEAILRSRRPDTIAAVGFVGLLVLLYLMMFKPALGFGAADAAACPAAPGDTVSVCAVDDRSFVTKTLEVPADQPFEISFANEDEGIQHNVAIYTDESAAEAVFVGDLIEGPAVVTYDVPAVGAGTYFFRCDVHPAMRGTLVAA